MKHIVFIFSLVVVILMMTVIIINHQEKAPKRFLSVQKYYSYLYEKDLEMKVSLYINDINHPLAHAQSYEAIELSNSDESKKLEMQLTKITYGYEEIYLNEIYQQMTLYMPLPDLGEDFMIQDLMMHVILINGDAYKISLGTLSLLSIDSMIEALNWTSLEGHKNDSFFISRLGTIYIEYVDLNLDIQSIKIGIDYFIDFKIEPTMITLEIPNEDILLDDVPIIVYYDDGSIQTIANFRYMFDYEILKESGMLISTYALN